MEKKFKIEKDIPLPDRKEKSSIYPFEQMGIGDSFEYSEIYSKKIQVRAWSAIRHWKLHPRNKSFRNWVFATRKVGDSIRIWRVK